MSDIATFRITPAGAPVGASVDGIDLGRRLDDATFRKIDAAYSQYGVLVFRDQDLTEAQLIAFTERFGEVERYVRNHYALPGYPEILVVSNVVENGRNIGLADAGATWHTDMSYIPAPPRGTVLHAREIPVKDGAPLGDTLFASTAAAYDDLPDDLKRRLDGARTTHSYEAKHARRASEGKSNRKPLSEAERAALPPVDHPVIRRHPVTGRHCIYVVAGECTGITGMSDADAEPLLESLAERCTRPQYVYRHRWRPGDVVMWDNCLVQHLAIQDYALPQRRLIWRTTVNGSVPV
jgi:alpha-ketoglutarate-dependent taurine dioxygenase